MAVLVLSMVDGRMTLSELAEASGVSADLACRIAGSLERDGHIRLGTSSSPVPASPSAPPREKREESRPASNQRTDATDAFEALVDAFEKDIGAHNYYEMLAVEPDADRATLKQAYFELSKKYHPDRAFGPRAAVLRKKMEVIFRHINRAYETLDDERERAEYDAHIADQIELWRIGRDLRRAAEARKPSAPSAAAPESRNVASRPSDPSRNAFISQRADLKPPPKEPQSAISARDAEARRMHWKKERMGRALGMVLQGPRDTPPRPPREDALAARLEEAAIAIETEKYSEATRILKGLISSGHCGARAQELLQRAEAGTAREISSGYVRQARYERAHGDPELAIEHFERAISADSTNLDARHQLAEMLLEKRIDLGRALRLCREIIGLGGQRAKYFATLGEILLLSKDKTRAVEAFEKALEIDPDNKDVKKKLKLCRS